MFLFFNSNIIWVTNVSPTTYLVYLNLFSNIFIIIYNVFYMPKANTKIELKANDVFDFL